MAQADGDVLRVWLSAQDTHRPRAGLAHALDRPPESIHVTLADVGGAFGSKGPPPPEAVVAAIAAIDLGRPVKWVETRSENFLAAYQGRGVEGEVELALDGDGRMLGIRARLVADTGAYLHQTTAFPPHTMGMLMTGAYDIAAADIEVVGARTDRVPTGPMRGAGRPEACFLLERTVDAAARELAIDPVELRRRNLITEFPYETPLGFTYDSGDYEQCLAKAVELVGEPPPGAGLGIALYVERAGGQWESAEMTREGDGRVIVRSSSFPHGQGHDTTYAQIVADRLGIPIEDVELRFGDSAEVPAGVGTFGGRSIAMAGSAIAVAADRLAAGERTASVRFESALVFGSGAYAAIVEIDEETGELTVHRIAAVDDAGTIINPLLAEGQVVGGAIHGLGTVLTEEFAYDEHGQPLTASFVSYALLSAGEQPPIETAFVESPSPLNPLGAKGIGEAGTIGTPAAIANAVADALGGRWVDPPFTPEKLWRALGPPPPAQRGGEGPGSGKARGRRGRGGGERGGGESEGKGGEGREGGEGRAGTDSAACTRGVDRTGAITGGAIAKRRRSRVILEHTPSLWRACRSHLRLAGASLTGIASSVSGSSSVLRFDWGSRSSGNVPPAV